MKLPYRWLLCLCFFINATNSLAQEFVTRAKIEFEKKENLQRSLAMRNASQQTRDIFPDSRTTYFDFAFAGGRSLYKAGRDNDPPIVQGKAMIVFPKSNNVLYTNFNTGETVTKKNILQEDFIFEDSIPPIKWKIGLETRKIAGYECRKAIGRIYDTVYLVAFYAEELVIKGGPEGIQGLPGMILGLAIPRYNTTWFATKVELANIDESLILPPAIKGKKLSKEEIKGKLTKKFETLGVKNPSASVNYYLKPNYFLDFFY